MAWHTPIKTVAVTGNLNTLVAGTTTAAGTLPVELMEPHSLSAEFLVDAETDTITISGIWQVSDDGSTWVDVKPENNAAIVVLATGTAGADAAVTVVLSAPPAVYGARFVRAAVRNAVATGAAADTYSIAYRYARPRFHG